jgi:hypothetical protein
MSQAYPGSAISPSELVELVEFATPKHFLSDGHLRDEADNLEEWCDGDPQLPSLALLQARTRGARHEVVAVLVELTARITPVGHRAAASA